jgi:hypothetical protein
MMTRRLQLTVARRTEHVDEPCERMNHSAWSFESAYVMTKNSGEYKVIAMKELRQI